jgi:hypothetical protein
MHLSVIATPNPVDGLRAPVGVARAFFTPCSLWISLAIAIASLWASHARAGGLTFTYSSFDAPAGDPSPPGVSIANGISNTGAIIGEYFTADSTFHGYELNNGVYTYFDAPGAGTGNSSGTYAWGINSAGQAIVSSASSDLSTSTNYLYSGGVYTAINDPLALPRTTQVYSINDEGIVTGTSYRNDGSWSFHYDVATQTFSAIAEVPAAAPHSTYAVATATNGDVVAYYLDASSSSVTHLAVQHDGVYTLLPDLPGGFNVQPTGINSSDVVSGDYTDAGGISHGFEYIGGTYYTVDYPGAAGTYLEGINDAGQAVGGWYEPSREIHSFLVTASVPEPSTFVMCGIAGVCLAGYARRRARGA